jgi:hypothetical protein
MRLPSWQPLSRRCLQAQMDEVKRVNGRAAVRLNDGDEKWLVSAKKIVERTCNGKGNSGFLQRSTRRLDGQDVRHEQSLRICSIIREMQFVLQHTDIGL